MAEGTRKLAQRPPALPEGVRPIDHLRLVLQRELRERPGGPVLVLTHRTPDPDALGALVGVKLLLERSFGIEAEIATIGRIHRAENLAMVRELALEFGEVDELDTERFAAAALVDSQPTFGHTHLPPTVPLVAVFDHHEPPPQERGPDVAVPHMDLRIGVGATSSMIYEYLRDAEVELDVQVATALCCGVRFDTNELAQNATPLDQEAYIETFRRADRKKLARIRRPALPMPYYRELNRSLARARRIGTLVFGLLGKVENPEFVAEMADFFLRMEGCRWSMIGGAYEGLYHLSLRTELGFGDAYPLLDRILQGEGSFGGRGSVAGGQVPLPLDEVEGDEDAATKRLERRLRARILKMVNPGENLGPEARFGRRLV